MTDGYKIKRVLTWVNGEEKQIYPARMYKYLRWTITANRNNINVTQMSEFEIYNNSGTKMARPSGTTITGNITGPSGETVDKIIDGSTSTKYCPNGALPVIITITLGESIKFDDYHTYKRYTANDESGRDPVSWTIEVSEDGNNWTLVDTVTNATITTTRYALAYTGTMVRPSSGGGWTPGTHTIAYYQFSSDILDHSGNNKNFTGSGYSFANNMITTTSVLTGPIVTPENTTGDRTINVWGYRASGYYCFRSSNIGSDGGINPYESENGYRPGVSFKLGNTWYRNYPSASDLPTMGSIILMTRTKTGTTMKLYVNGVLTSTNSSLDTATWTSPNGITKTYLDPGTYGEIIVEDKIWTDSEILNYYNQTKSNYGL